MDLRARITAFLRGQHRSAWIAGMGMLIAAACFFGWQVANPRCAVPHFHFQAGEIVSYSKLLAEYTIPPICIGSDNFMATTFLDMATVFALALTLVIAFVRLVSGGTKWLLAAAFALAAVVLSCNFVWEVTLSSGGTPLMPLQTIQFDGHVIHLVRVIDPNGGMDFSERVTTYLFICDSSGEKCFGRQVDVDYLGNYGDYHLEVSDNPHRLIVYETEKYNHKWNVATIEAP